MLSGSRIFDTEWIGYLLAENLADQEFADFQQLPPWRTLVPPVLQEVSRFTGQNLVVPQSVLVEDYWHEIRDGLRRCSLDLFHVVLHVDPDVLTERIEKDPLEAAARQWRLDHRAGYAGAQAWELGAADLVIDSTSLTVADVAARITAALTARRSD